MYIHNLIMTDKFSNHQMVATTKALNKYIQVLNANLWCTHII